MITKEQALTASSFEHATEKNRDGTPLRARRNGKTVTWATRPNEFRVPVKYGLKFRFYIDHHTAESWTAKEK